MFVARHLCEKSVRIALVDGEELVDLETEHDDLPGLLASGVGIDDLASGPRTPLSDAQLLSPVGTPPAILAVGLNYRAHAEEGDENCLRPRLFSQNITTALSEQAPKFTFQR